MAKEDRAQRDEPEIRSAVHVGDLLDSAAAQLPEDHPQYPLALRLVLFELFSSLRDAENVRRDGRDRAAAIDAVRAVYTFLTRFERRPDDDLLTSFLSLESALMVLDQGVVEPLLQPTRSHGRGWNSRDREFAIAAAVTFVRQLRWAGMTAEQADKAVAQVLRTVGFRAARGSRAVDSSTVRHWRAKTAEDVGQHTEAAKIVNDLSLDNPRPKATQQEAVQKRLLGALERFLKLRCSAVLQKDSYTAD